MSSALYMFKISFSKYSKYLINIKPSKFYSSSLHVKMDLILDSDENTHPSCPHGPTFLFKKTDAKRNTSRKFFACSANRDRKFCQFFHWADTPISEEKRNIWKSVAQQYVNSLDLTSLHARQIKLKKSSPEHVLKFCRKCSLVLFSSEWSKHSSHGPLDIMPFTKRMEPTTFLTPLEEKKTNAQYFFSDNSVKFIVDSLKEFNIRRVLCIGTPRIFEHILSRKEDLDMSCLLMDMDHRYAQFYNRQNFILYNMFNHHFFEGQIARQTFEQFVTSPDNTALVIDPPFGGLIGALACTIHKVTNHRREQDMPVLLFFPYFNEDRISQEMPALKMLDYKVNYVNHGKFKEGGSKQGSVVRIFTNLDPAKFILPADEGYRFCSICQRFVSNENSHCVECNTCTSKDGRPYKHCKKCGRCCKSSWEHCSVCNRCALPDHPCLSESFHTVNEEHLDNSFHEVNSKKRKKRKHDSK